MRDTRFAGGNAKGRLVRVAATALLAAAATSCAVNPVTGKRELTLVTENQEIEMGKQAAEEAAASIGLYDSPEAQRYVSDIGKRLAATSERPNLPWSFQVVDDPVVNAFALPGGFIFVTRGLLTHLNSEAQLAAVLGHEIGHVTARHSVKMLSRAQLAQLGLVVGMVVSDTMRALGENAMAGMQLLFLKYGRDAERQADDLGYAYSINGGYDVRAMPAVFATLKRVGESAGAERLPNWMSSHPSPDERIERIEKMIAEKSPPAGKTDRDSLLAITNGMPYGPNPRQGFFEGGVFKHPEMKFQVTIPRGWKAQNLAAAVVAEPPSGKAGFQLTLAKAGAPAQALQQFSQNQAISGVEPVQLPIQGLDASSARFVAKTEGGQVGGLVTFVSYQGKTFQLLGLAPADGYSANEPAFREALSSFKPLTDPAALNVQPARVKVVSVPQAMTFSELASKQSSLPAEKLAIVNQVEPGARLTAGQKIKIVEGTVRQASTGTVAANQ